MRGGYDSTKGPYNFLRKKKLKIKKKILLVGEEDDINSKIYFDYYQWLIVPSLEESILYFGNTNSVFILIFSTQ